MVHGPPVSDQCTRVQERRERSRREDRMGGRGEEGREKRGVEEQSGERGEEGREQGRD